MTPFLTYENYEACAENRIDVLKMAIKQGWDISAKVIEDIIEEDIFKPDSTCFIYDEGYDDFEDRGRWTIGKYYIIVVDGEYYQFWEEAGLTELQESHFYDQSFIKVRQVEIKETVWEDVE